jgi:hypothetical protein
MVAALRRRRDDADRGALRDAQPPVPSETRPTIGDWSRAFSRERLAMLMSVAVDIGAPIVAYGGKFGRGGMPVPTTATVGPSVHTMIPAAAARRGPRGRPAW